MNKIGEYALKIAGSSLFGALILVLLNMIWGIVMAWSDVWGGIIGVLLAGLLFILAAYVRKGEEKFAEMFPISVIAIAIIAIIAKLFPTSSLDLTTQFSFMGLALAFSAVFMGSAIMQKILKNI